LLNSSFEKNNLFSSYFILMKEEKFSWRIDEKESSPVIDEISGLKSIVLVKQKSEIHGIGVFTKTKIRQGKNFYIVPVNDVRSSPALNYSKLAFGKFISDSMVLNFVNHSCEANAELLMQEQSVVLRAKRDIEVGEEITLDYCALEEKNTLVFCNCKSKKCRNYFYTSY